MGKSEFQGLVFIADFNYRGLQVIVRYSKRNIGEGEKLYMKTYKGETQKNPGILK